MLMLLLVSSMKGTNTMGRRKSPSCDAKWGLVCLTKHGCTYFLSASGRGAYLRPAPFPISTGGAIKAARAARLETAFAGRHFAVGIKTARAARLKGTLALRHFAICKAARAALFEAALAARHLGSSRRPAPHPAPSRNVGVNEETRDELMDLLRQRLRRRPLPVGVEKEAQPPDGARNAVGLPRGAAAVPAARFAYLAETSVKTINDIWAIDPAPIPIAGCPHDGTHCRWCRRRAATKRTRPGAYLAGPKKHQTRGT